MIPDRTRSRRRHPIHGALMLGGMAALAAAALTLARPPVPASAAGCDPAGTPVTWDGDASNGLWNDPLNWTADTLPAPGSHVCIVGAGIAVTLDTGSASVATLEVDEGASMAVGAATLEITGPDPSTIASLGLFGGTLAGSGTRTITGSLALYGGTLTGSATTSIASGASLAIAPGGGQNRLTIAGGHVLRIEQGASATWGPTNTDIDIQAPSSLVNAGTLLISNDTQVIGSGTFVNSGTLAKDSHLQTTLVAPFDNDGTLELRAGTLEVAGEGLDNTGILRVGAGRVFRAVSYRQSATGVLEVGLAAASSGQLVVTTGPTTLDGTLSLVVDPGVVVPETGILLVAVTGERTGEFGEVVGLETFGTGAQVVYSAEGVRLMGGATP